MNTYTYIQNKNKTYRIHSNIVKGDEAHKFKHFAYYVNRRCIKQPINKGGYSKYGSIFNVQWRREVYSK